MAGREGYIYAVLFSDGWIKVGRGQDPTARARKHAYDSLMRGADVVEVCASGLHADCHVAEKNLIAACAENGRLVRGLEWFDSLDFAVVKRLIEDELPGDSLDYIKGVRQKVWDSGREFVEWTVNSLYGGEDLHHKAEAIEILGWDIYSQVAKRFTGIGDVHRLAAELWLCPAIYIAFADGGFAAVAPGIYTQFDSLAQLRRYHDEAKAEGCQCEWNDYFVDIRRERQALHAVS